MIVRRIIQSASATISEKSGYLEVYHLNITLGAIKRDIGVGYIVGTRFWIGN